MSDQGEINVEKMRIEIEAKLNELCTSTSSDFSAYAQVNEHNHEIHWRYVHGNQNIRYKQMIGKPGKGLSGSVLRFGRNIVIDQNTPNAAQRRLEYPIMLAENLHSAIAVPVKSYNQIIGILLIGSRSLTDYNDDQISKVCKIAEEISSYFLKAIP
jgi:nitrogen regulatory protein A